ncbi:MAG: hypothetical protein HWD58_10940 [Bacteroidota bacterium]|nr:MAG: hypothetical protein HWD58_10940 [Bacteroidota bacterium]
MKQNLLALIALLLVGHTALAQTWNGTVSNVWTNPLNWTPNVVPTSASYVVINAAPNYPKLAGNTTLAALSTNAGASLDVNGFSLSIGNAGAYNNLSGTTFLNTNGSTDIVFNITTPTGGYNFQINGCTFSDHVTFNISGGSILEAQSGANTYTGHVIYNINSGLTTNFSVAGASQYNGNLNVNRTVAGSTSLFITGGLVTGNFNYQNTVGGNTGFGNMTNTTTMNGTCTINANYPTPATFGMQRIKTSHREVRSMFRIVWHLLFRMTVSRQLHS